jgi:hypothetical protein
MLPFLKHDQDASVSSPVSTQIRKPDEEGEYSGLHAAAEDLVNAVHAKNIKAVAEALKAAFDLCDSEPHVEGEHE